MKPSHLAVTAAVAALCTGILVLFTDVELSVVRWLNCGPFSTLSEDESEVCKRQL
jgi:hypothetical protein